MFLYTLILSFLLSTCRASTHLQLFSHAKESKLALPAEELIENALKALGGEDSLKRIKGVTYSSPRVYRTQTLMQNYGLVKGDQFVSLEGRQNMSFSYADNQLSQRIDRHFIPAYFWLWAKGSLAPIEYSLVVRGGDDGFACYVRGSNLVYMDPDFVGGYTDGVIAEYLVNSGTMASPRLLADIKSNNASKSSLITLRKGIQLPAITDEILNLTVVFDPATSLPHIIRSYEQHHIYGLSTNDLQLSNYTEIDGVKFPLRQQRVYDNPLNSDAVLEDVLIEHVEVNPNFIHGFFDGLPSNQSDTSKTAPKQDPERGRAVVGEGFSNMISGLESHASAGVGKLNASHPAKDLPKLWNLQWENTIYAQLVMEFENGVVIAEAPLHQAKPMIAWVKQHIGKPITHVWPSHHHRDHSGDAAEFVKIGAKLIVAEISVDYWKSIPNVELVTFNDKEPYVHRDGNMQAWFMWQKEAVHSADWSYVMVTKTCPEPDSSMVVFNADIWSLKLNALNFDNGDARQWLDQTLEDGLSKGAIVAPSHGAPTPLTVLLELTGYMYPNLTTSDWKNGALKCR